MLRHGLGFLVFLLGVGLFEHRVNAQGGVGNELDYVVTFSAIGKVDDETVLEGNQNGSCDYEGPADILYYSSVTIKNNTNSAATFHIKWELKCANEGSSYWSNLTVPANSEVTWEGPEGQGYQIAATGAFGYWVGDTTVTLVGGGMEGYHKYEFNDTNQGGPGQGL